MKRVAETVKRYVRYARMHVYYWREEMAWKRSTNGNRPPTPHRLKRRVVRQYARRFGRRTFVESGTYFGDMLVAMLPHFDELHSIELSGDLYEQARVRFANRKQVYLHNGDSAAVMPAVVAALSGPALFWLDAHYSGGVTARGSVDTPILDELRCILGHDHHPHVVLIDDARCLTGDGAGTPDLQQVRALIASLRPDYTVTLEDDIIRAHPAEEHAAR